MLKKILLFLVTTTVILAMIFANSKSSNAEELTTTGESTSETTEQETENSDTEEQKTGYITLIATDGGDVLYDIEEGNVGDEVTVYVKADILFSVSTLKINNESIAISEDGTYKFNLIEGENIIDVEFEINSEQLSEIASLINGVKDNGFSSLFTVENLLNVISWAISLFLSSGFFITLIKNKKLKSKTVDEVIEIVKETLASENAEILTNFLKELIGPSLETITAKMDSVNECVKVFCRCFVLSQDDTAENKLAIIEELTKLSNSDSELTAKIKKIIEENQKELEEKIEARDKAIEELKKSNEALVDGNASTTESDEDSYGQL